MVQGVLMPPVFLPFRSSHGREKENLAVTEASWCVSSAWGFAGSPQPRGSVAANESFLSCTVTLPIENRPLCPRAAGQRRKEKAPSSTSRQALEKSGNL